MITKHTPAPWVLEIRKSLHAGDASLDATVAEIGMSGEYRGGIAYTQSAEHIGGIGRDELIANAHLIAAAPDMLEALKQCAEYFYDIFAYVDHDMDGFYPFEQNNMSMLISKAIAKAEGRS